MARTEGNNLCSKDPRAVADELRAARENVPAGVPIIFHTETEKLADAIEKVSNGRVRRTREETTPGTGAVITTGKGPVYKK